MSHTDPKTLYYCTDCKEYIFKDFLAFHEGYCGGSMIIYKDGTMFNK